MTTLQTNIREFMTLAGQTVRNKPSILTREEAELRVRLVFEEAFELADALGVDVCVACREVGRYPGILNFKHLEFEQCGPQQNIVDAADAIADLNYVVNGCAVAMGVDIEPIDQEVHRSNMSKIVGGSKDANGKWIKPDSYSLANIEDIIKDQSV